MNVAHTGYGSATLVVRRPMSANIDNEEQNPYHASVIGLCGGEFRGVGSAKEIDFYQLLSPSSNNAKDATAGFLQTRD
jgi:hypothetical protein